MEDFHDAILQAYGFCDVKLYNFLTSGEAWTESSINRRLVVGTISKLNSNWFKKQGDTILCIYYYGMEWQLKIKVVEIVDR
ncbi:hypothetical protein CEH05_16845 [Halobacillus halophilus]|nr:hypothetical protein CEH05_16845 [Halobacillus halophilus]